eukprot:TRINITY_DN15092_c0_g1_i1.p1 TRINITY_DN15092_c0_g1~~TRINITY_DN15092_c0_g1_i1.p1  ORF type:complete len:196 (-),score=57.71 TRINITY_DN15092_c0_g1_i1:112-699(-)
MLKRMQAKYAGKNVRFLLVPCNQFGAQEPAANSAIKAFAEQSVTLGKAGVGSNVIMLAKSNLNNEPCEYSGADACTPASAGCCPFNDAVYKYLLAKTPPGTIQWNFDKIIVGKDGKPFEGEEILHGPDLDKELSLAIDIELMARSEEDTQELFSVPKAAIIPFTAVVSAAFIMLLAARGCSRSAQEETAPYILVE